MTKRPTACDIVPERSEWDTCAGAGTAKPSNQPVLPAPCRRHRWATVQGKMMRRRKLLGMCARRRRRQSPAPVLGVRPRVRQFAPRSEAETGVHALLARFYVEKKHLLWNLRLPFLLHPKETIGDFINFVF
jgi:hypothetical protein